MGFSEKTVHVVGAGLAGSECAYQLALKGHKVVLHEMRPSQMTPAHKTGLFAELVCSNSLGSQTDYSAPGQLKWEAEKLGSLILNCARQATVPAGMALAVDRELFANSVTSFLRSMPQIEIRTDIVKRLHEIPRPAVIATGPLTESELALDLKQHFDDEFLYFFDAIAPIVDADTINKDIVWRADRYDKGTKDYLNCPLTKNQYFDFIDAIQAARKIEPKEFEKTAYFEGCMPIEEMVARGRLTPRFGPMSPSGLRDPKTGLEAFAVVQLRQENREATAFNMVGFQTRMAYGEQTRVFRTIPGLENAEFLKLGSIHRNLYINSPKRLTRELSSQKDPELYFAGQITGVEGYFESTCIGLLVAHFLDDRLNDRPVRPPPRETALGCLHAAITEDRAHFQPVNINFGLFPLPPEVSEGGRMHREAKRDLQLQRARRAFEERYP